MVELARVYQFPSRPIIFQITESCPLEKRMSMTYTDKEIGSRTLGCGIPLLDPPIGMIP